VTTVLVVQLEDGLDASRLVGLFHALRLHPGVVSVCDLGSIQRETLDMLLRPGQTCEDALTPKKQRRRQKTQTAFGWAT
jgi:hypothetical protein